MVKKSLYLLVLVASLVLMAACSSASASSSLQQSGDDQTGAATSGNQTNQANQPIESKLVTGTLKLEGTDQALTAEQAKTLLPLWKAVKSLSNSDTASADEISALYTQIQESMTAEQVQAIKDMSLSPDDTQALMEQYGVEMLQGGPGNLTDEQRAAFATQRAANGTNNSGDMPQRGADGGMPGGGMPQWGADGGMPGGGMPPDGRAGSFPGGANGAQPSAQGTPGARGAGRGMRGGMNNLLLDPLIKLLEDRAGA